MDYLLGEYCELYFLVHITLNEYKFVHSIITIYYIISLGMSNITTKIKRYCHLSTKNNNPERNTTRHFQATVSAASARFSTPTF